MPPKKSKTTTAAAASSSASADASDSDVQVHDTEGPSVTVAQAQADLTGDAYESVVDAALKTTDSCGLPIYFGSTNWNIMNINAKVAAAQKPATAKRGKEADADEDDTQEASAELLGPHRLLGTGETPLRHVAASPSGTSFALVSKSGALFVFGRNDMGQLGLGHNRSVPYPYLAPGLIKNKIVNVAVGKRHILALQADGTVLASGDNRCGQLGLGNQTNQSTFVPVPFQSKIKRIACGADFSMLVDLKGAVYSCGLPEYGQLGHNTDGQYFVSANKLSFHWELMPRLIEMWCEKDRNGRAARVPDVKIDEICCGNNHTVALDSIGRVWTWGFGGYGRLGHSDNKNEMVPRLIALFAQPHQSVIKIAVGGTFSMAVTKHNQLYLWGQAGTRGEASMYPKPVQDLGGYKIPAMAGGNKHIVVQADDKFVTWGGSPCYGELGYGDKEGKSSTKPKIVEPMDGILAIDIAAAYASTLVLASEACAENVKKLPTYGKDA